jgi:hypothetical protein
MQWRREKTSNAQRVVGHLSEFGGPFEAVALPVSRRNSRSSEALRCYRANFFLITI